MFDKSAHNELQFPIRILVSRRRNVTTKSNSCQFSYRGSTQGTSAVLPFDQLASMSGVAAVAEKLSPGTRFLARTPMPSGVSAKTLTPLPGRCRADGRHNSRAREVAKSWQWLSSDYNREVGCCEVDVWFSRKFGFPFATTGDNMPHPTDSTNLKVFSLAEPPVELLVLPAW